MAGHPVATTSDDKAHNTLTGHQIRVPIGWSASDDAPHPSATSYFWIVIPTDTGGMLRVERKEGGPLELRSHDDAVLAAGTDEIVHKVPLGWFGTVYVVIQGGGAAVTVECSFEQVGTARESSADASRPLIPWNFWYWPSAQPIVEQKTVTVNGVKTIQEVEIHNPDLETIVATLRRYATATGKDPDLAERWERTLHGKKGPRWQGHCNHAAHASVLIEEPVARALNGQPFSEEELEYLAAEWFGNFANVDLCWDLARGKAFWKFKDNLYHPMVFKPSGGVTASELAFALQSYDSSRSYDQMLLIAEALFEQDKGLKKLVVGWFGELAATFYETLIKEILVDKQALVADLRSQDADGGPAEVWNHAIFHYRATYIENPQTHDAADMIVTIELSANEDFRSARSGISEGFPAAVNRAGEVVPGGMCRRSLQELRIIFSGGRIMSLDPRNEWRSSRANPSGRELYAPLMLFRMAPQSLTPGLVRNNPPKKNPTDPEPNLEIGNIIVGMDLVTGPAPLLSVRKRYVK